MLLEAHRVRSADDRELVEGDVQPVMSPAAVFAAVGRLSEQMADAGGPCGCGHALRDHAWGDGPASGPCLRGDCPCAAFKAAELRRGPESRPAPDRTLEDAERELEELRGALEVDAERLEAARRALVETGYFSADQVGLDVAPRITELWSAAQAVAEPALCSQCGERESVMVKVGTVDGWCSVCLDEAAEPVEPTGELADFGVDGHRHDCTAVRASSIMAIKCDCAADLFALAQKAEVAALENHAECAAVTAAATESRFPLTDDARKLAVDLAQAAASAAGVLAGEDITVVRRAVQRVLADAGVIVRVHWAHPTAHVPACMVADAWVYRRPAECQATREHGEVTCRECMDQLPVELRGLGTRVDAPAFPTPQRAPSPVSKPDDEARGEWLSLAAAWHDYETGDAWDRGEVLPWMRRIVELADPPEGRLAHVAYDLGGAGRACWCSRGANHGAVDEPEGRLVEGEKFYAAQRFDRDGQAIRSGGVSGPIVAMCATPDLAEELVALWNRHA